MENIQDYTETDAEREVGHEDTRSANFQCDRPRSQPGMRSGDRRGRVDPRVIRQS